MKNQTAQARTMTAGQMKDIVSALVETIPSNLSFEVAEQIIGSKGNLSKKVKNIFTSMIENPYADILLDWEHFYLKHFQKTYDFASLAVPVCPGSEWRLLVVVGLALEQLYVKCKELFPCWRWTDNDFDKIVTKNERDAKNSAYAIWVKSDVEADENLKNLSANDIKTQGMSTETLAERLVHELKFFTETGKHLDVTNITLCAGSRYDDGVVPFVHWYDRKMHVSGYSPGVRNARLRSRQAVSSAEGGK